MVKILQELLIVTVRGISNMIFEAIIIAAPITIALVLLGAILDHGLTNLNRK